MNAMKILFMGTPLFAIPSLEAIVDGGYELLGVVTQPDRQKGRGKHVMPPPVKEWAVARNIPVYQPEKVREPEFIEIVQNLSPDLIVTAAFGQILPKKILDIPPLGCINVHASLLPKYHGASPIQQAIIDGERETGITIMYMDIGMDTGDIILQRKIEIGEEEDSGHLHDRLAQLGGEALKDALKLFEGGQKPAGIPQNEKEATYCSKIEKSMGEIDWNKNVEEIRNLIRGLTPWPGAYTRIDDLRLKVLKAGRWEKSIQGEYVPGQIVVANPKDGLVIAARDGLMRLYEIQGPGKRPMADIEYLRGNPIPTGIVIKKEDE